MSKMPVEVLSTDEVERLIAHPTSDDVVGLRDTAILATLYYAAATASEVSSLDISDIRRRARSLRFRGDDGGERRAPLEKRLARMLDRYVKKSRPLLLAQGGVTDARRVPAAFITNRGHRIHVRDIRQLLGSHSKAVGIGTAVNTNTLRLSRAWHLREQGVSPEAIQRLLGTSSRSGRRVV
jgi:site-specific recombinase XerD